MVLDSLRAGDQSSIESRRILEFYGGLHAFVEEGRQGDRCLLLGRPVNQTKDRSEARHLTLGLGLVLLKCSPKCVGLRRIGHFWQRRMNLLLGKPHLAKLPVKEVEKILVARHRSSPIVHGGGKLSRFAVKT